MVERKRKDGDAYYRQSGNLEIAHLQSPSKDPRLVALTEAVEAVVSHQITPGTSPSTVACLLAQGTDSVNGYGIILGAVGVCRGRRMEYVGDLGLRRCENAKVER